MNDQPRHPAGTPTGGQWSPAGHTNPDPAVTLNGWPDGPTVDELETMRDTAAETHYRNTTADYAATVLADHPDADTVRFGVDRDAHAYGPAEVTAADGRTLVPEYDDTTLERYGPLIINPDGPYFDPDTLEHVDTRYGEQALLHVRDAIAKAPPVLEDPDNTEAQLEHAQIRADQGAARDYARTILTAHPDAETAHFDINWGDNEYAFRGIRTTTGRFDDLAGTPAGDATLNISPDGPPVGLDIIEHTFGPGYDEHAILHLRAAANQEL